MCGCAMERAGLGVLFLCGWLGACQGRGRKCSLCEANLGQVKAMGRPPPNAQAL